MDFWSELGASKGRGAKMDEMEVSSSLVPSADSVICTAQRIYIEEKSDS